MMQNKSPLDSVPRKVALLISAAMITAGLVLGVWIVARSLPGSWRAAAEAGVPQQAFDAAAPDADAELPVPAEPLTGSATITPIISTTPSTLQNDAPPRPLEIAMDDAVPPSVRAALESAPPPGFTLRLAAAEAALPDLRMDLDDANSVARYQQVYAATTRFDTIHPHISWRYLRTLWRGTDAGNEATGNEAPDNGSTGSLAASLRAAAAENQNTAVETAENSAEFTAIAVLAETMPALESVLGTPGAAVAGYETIDEIVAVTYGDELTIAIIPFEQLRPTLLSLSIDGQTPVENEHKFDAERYPLSVDYHMHIVDSERSASTGINVFSALPQLPVSNRDPGKLTVLAMTGVTAMARNTAAQMDELGDAWPAEVVGPELSLADITHISNEVPFVPGCETDTRTDNFVFCSKPSYMRTLEAVGTDIVGLTGNHQNDFGREDALTSLEIYAEAGLPVYGGGVNKEAAFAPLYMEHNGNRLAFLGANSFGPDFAWASDDLPGSAEFDLNILSAMIRNIKENGLADLVLVEVQYEERYDVEPMVQQRIDFLSLVTAGADIVTGVQSHVPQSLEFDEGKLVLYGLGNLFFDQMWTQETREGLVPKHTFYAGHHISTQLLTTVLYDSGQPHWATPEERETILNRVFGASQLE